MKKNWNSIFADELKNKKNIFFPLCVCVDATQEYINGVTQRKYPKIAASGLECVTVLIGLYDKGNGKPLAGIVNQPFYEKTELG